MSDDWWVVEYDLWPTFDAGPDDLGRHRDRGMFRADDEIGAINAMVYYVRGRKSHYEVAAIADVHGPFKSREEAVEVCYDDSTNDRAHDRAGYLPEAPGERMNNMISVLDSGDESETEAGDGE